MLSTASPPPPPSPNSCGVTDDNDDECPVLFKNARFLHVSVPFTFYKILENASSSVPWKEKAKRTPPTGLEPAIFGLGGRRVIHYATEADVVNTQ